MGNIGRESKARFSWFRTMLFLIGLLARPSIATAQEEKPYYGPRKMARLQINRLAPSVQGFCDVHDYYLRVGINSSRLVTLNPTMHFEHQEACYSAPPSSS